MNTDRNHTQIEVRPASGEDGSAPQHQLRWVRTESERAKLQDILGAHARARSDALRHAFGLGINDAHKTEHGGHSVNSPRNT